jgi:hypothetical protein
MAWGPDTKVEAGPKTYKNLDGVMGLSCGDRESLP